jgi:ParB family transcriptional regulator, chromosome partitioning protein
MHPADQHDAFAKLHGEQGMAAEDIAARFGVTAAVVRQRLKLAAVSPTLIQAYRDGEMALDELTAFTVTDDHAKQERVWEELPPFASS